VVRRPTQKLMRLHRALVIVLAASSLAACANLNVQVDVLQPAYLTAAKLDAELRSEAHRLALGDSSQTTQFVEQQRLNYLDFQRQCAEAGIKHEEKLLNTLTTADIDAGAKKVNIINARNNADVLKKYLEKLTSSTTNDTDPDDPVTQVNTKFSAFEHDALAWDRSVQNSITGSFPRFVGSDSLTQPIPGELRVKLFARRQFLDGMVARIFEWESGERSYCSIVKKGDTPLLSEQAQSSPAVHAVEAVASAKVAATTETILGGGATLAADIGAFDAVKAPDSAWATKYNQAFGSAQFGNASVGIKLNQVADFSIKGFAFDGRSTATLVGKLTQQTLSIIAQSYGVHLPSAGAAGAATVPSGAGSSADPNALGTTIADDAAKVAAAQANGTAYRGALFHIADLIVRDEAVLKANSPQSVAISQAITAGQATWISSPSH
jgi:hypothetical protein